MIVPVFSLAPWDIPNGVFYLDLQNTDADNNDTNEPSNGSQLNTIIDSFWTHTGTQIFSSKQAIYNSGAINDHPWAFFDGADDLFEIYDHVDIWSGTGYSEKSFSMVFKTSDDINTTQVIYEQWWKKKWFLFAIHSWSLYAWVYNSIDWPTGEEYKIMNTWTIETDTVYILVFVYDSNNDFVRAYINGTLSSTLNSISEQTTNGACPLDGTSFGCALYMTGGSIGLGAVKNDTVNPSNSNEVEVFEGYHFQGYLWEIASWNTALTDTQSTEITDFLMEKWWFDDTAPIITSATPGSWGLLPWWNHTIRIEYNDTHTGSSWIDVSSISLSLHKWDWISTYGSDISGTSITEVQVWTGSAEYTTNNLSFWRYEYRFSISDNLWNTQTWASLFYIDQPEFTVSQPQIDIWDIVSGESIFSPTVTVTVKTVWAGFNVILNRSTAFQNGTNTIPSWNNTEWYGYQDTPFLWDIETINTDQIIASQWWWINVNGEKNTFTFDIQLWAFIDLEQVAGEYEGTVDFGINLSY